MNTESDTPRTDACWDDESCNILLHARQLERELNALTSERNNLNASLTAAISSSNARHFESMEHEAKSKQLERELNEANRLQRKKMGNYRKITILFADEEPAMAYSDEKLAQTVLERCEEWREKNAAIYYDCFFDRITASEYHDKEKAHKDAHPLDPSYVNAQYYVLKTVLLYE